MSKKLWIIKFVKNNELKPSSATWFYTNYREGVQSPLKRL